MEKHYALTETANLIRQTLKAVFPDTKFSVTSKRYSGGSTIGISYTDGPLSKDVYAITQLFEGNGFDGRTDSTYHHDAKSFRGELATFNHGYVQVNRHVSDAVLQIAAYRVHKETKLPLLTFADSRFTDGEYQVQFTYLKELDRIAHGVLRDGEWYSQLVYEVARNTATPHKRGKIELPQVVDARLVGLSTKSTLAPN